MLLQGSDPVAGEGKEIEWLMIHEVPTSKIERAKAHWMLEWSRLAVCWTGRHEAEAVDKAESDRDSREGRRSQTTRDHLGST